jgi:hypothetical protein
MSDSLAIRRSPVVGSQHCATLDVKTRPAEPFLPLHRPCSRVVADSWAVAWTMKKATTSPCSRYPGRPEVVSYRVRESENNSDVLDRNLPYEMVICGAMTIKISPAQPTTMRHLPPPHRL